MMFGAMGLGKTSLCHELLKKSTKPKVIVDPWGYYRKFEEEGATLVPRLTEKILFTPGICLVVDELRMVFSTERGRDWVAHVFPICFGFTRNLKQDYILGTHRPRFIPREATALSTYIYVFMTSEPDDLDYFAGFKNKGVDDEVIKRIANLKPGKYLRIPINPEHFT